MIRLLSLTTSFPRTAVDPAGSFVAGHAVALRDAGAWVRVLAPGSGWAPAGVERRSWRAAPGVLNQGGGPEALQRNPLRAGLAGVASTASLVASATRHGPWAEVVVGHWLLPSGPAAIAAARPGVPVHLYAHGGDVALLERLPLGRALARHLDARAAITFVSEDLRARFNALLPGAPRPTQWVLPMGVSTPKPDPAWITTLKTLAADRLIVATVGRLTAIKGLDVLARALAGRQDVLWMAAGDGDQRAALQAQCRALQVPFAPLGVLAPGARDALLAVADVFVLPSRPLGGRTEGTPVSLLEALVSGVPAVASRTGGVAAVGQRAGVALVPPDDPSALRAQINALLISPTLRTEVARQHRAYGAQFLWSRLGALHAARVLS